jgi:hypothetical protein
MSDEASPRPWFVNGHSIEANDPDGLWLQNEKTGWGVVANLPSCPKSRMSKKNRETWDAVVEANAALIVDAVNEYARRENWRKKYIDRRMNDAARLEGLYADISDLEAERDRLRDLVRRLLMLRRGDIAVPMDVEKQILAEARAAIGEDAK